MPSDGWVPILEGATAERAREAVDQVARCIAALRPGTHGHGASAAGGDAGFAILFAELAQSGHAGAADHAVDYLDAAVEAVSASAMTPSLFAGFLSVAWTMTLLGDSLLQPGDEPAGGEVDAVLLEHLRTTPWQGEYDLISGLAGFGVYALSRYPSPFSEVALELIVDRLAELAQGGAGGYAWFTTPERLPQHQREQNPHGLYDVGLAHGVPGVVAFLGQVVAAGVGGRRAGELLDGGLRWLDRQRLPAGSPSAFPAQIGAAPPSWCRLAWCYGDAGVAAAMRLASAGAPGAGEAAVQLLLDAAARPPDSCGVRDAGLCHGSAGLALIFDRFYQWTGEERFRAAAAGWFEDALDRRDPADAMGGFLASRYEVLEPDPGLLNGSAGVALALLAGLEAREPAWDQLLMLRPARTGVRRRPVPHTRNAGAAHRG